MKQVQEWLGHSTYTTTADIYSHLDYSNKVVVGNAIGGLFGENGIDRDIDEKNQVTITDNEYAEYLKWKQLRGNRAEENIDNLFKV